MKQITTATHYDPISKIWSGPKRKDFYGSDMTLGEVILHNLSKTPDKVIQVMDTTGEELTAGQLIQESKLLAIAIQKFGLQIGDVVGIMALNTTNLTAAIVGSFLCGTPIHAIHPDFDKKTIKYIYEVSQPKLIFCDIEIYEKIKSVINDLKLDTQFVTVNGKVNGVKCVKDLLVSVNDNIDFDALKFPCSNMKGDDTVSILCSSGSTGTPKGVLCSHNSVINRPIFFNLSEDSVVFSFSTMYWASGHWILYASLMNGVKRVITTKNFTPTNFVEIIEKYRISHMMTTPHQWAALLKETDLNLKNRLNSLKAVICGGAKVPKVISEPVNAILENSYDKNIVCYGMSEVMAISRNETHNRREGTEGKLEPNTEVRIAGTDGQYLGPNEEGILHVRTLYKWLGYYRNPEATRKAYVDGWLITGDIGYFDNDGYLHICSRNSDMFKCNGFQIYPELIEEVIIELPGVQEVCVFGIPDFATGYLPACAVVRRNDKNGIDLTADRVKMHVKQKLISAYQIEGGVYFVHELPKTSSGKILRRKMIEIIDINKNNAL